MEARMDDRKALITGGSLGLGKAMGLAFATSGAQVGLVARRGEVLKQAKAEIEAAGGKSVKIYPCDVRDPAALEAMFEKAQSEMGQVDILVNNAGTSATGAFEDISDEDWRHDLDLKLFAAIRLCRLALPAMKAQKWGRIINVLNTGAKAPGAKTAPTAVSRAAGMALTKILSQEYAPYNVLVNALCTGQLVSDQWERRHEREASGISFEAFVDKMGEAIPLGRMGQAHEFAHLACFLASDLGSFITGTAINVDGGRCPVV